MINFFRRSRHHRDGGQGFSGEHGRSDLPRVAPSSPYGTLSPGVLKLTLSQLKSTYASAREAEQQNQLEVARLLYERIAGSYLSSRDDALVCPQLAVALVRSAELGDVSGSHQAAADRYLEAAKVFDILANDSYRQGNFKASQLAKVEGDDARRRAQTAFGAASAAKAKQDAILRQEAILKNQQWDSWVRALGRS